MSMGHMSDHLTQEMTELRDRVVSSLAATASSSTGSMRRSINRLADFLARGDIPNCVVNHPVLLEIFLRLGDLPNATQSQIDGVVEQTISRVYRRTRGEQPWWIVLFYPLVVIVVCSIVVGGICWLVVPTFEKMFQEFGITLPTPTLALIAISHAVGNPALYVAILIVSVCAAALLWFLSGNEWRIAGQTATNTGPRFMRGWFPSKRAVWADWAWHLSLLLRFGKQETEAITIAGQASGKRWLRKGSAVWTDAIRAGHQPFKKVTHFHGVACHVMSLALDADEPTDARAKLLAFVAELYWDRDQSRTQWKLSWLSPIITFLIGLLIWFILLALFMPMVSLISGLS